MKTAVPCVLAAALSVISSAQTPVWMSSTPIERNRASMAYDSARKVAVMFGGFTDIGGNAIRETWE